MLHEKSYQDGDLSTHEAFLASQRTPLIWQIIEKLSVRLRPQSRVETLDADQDRATGTPSIYKSVRLR